MTTRFAEIVFEVDPPEPADHRTGVDPLCNSCFSVVRHNPRLRVSFCPVHGLGFQLLFRGAVPVSAPSNPPPRGGREA